MIGKMPRRIKLSRKKGYRKPTDSVNVTRQTKWGNPFNWKKENLSAISAGTAKAIVKQKFERWLAGHPVFVEGQYVTNYLPSKRKWILEHLSELQDKDLACWCGPNDHCHADVYLDLANRSGSSRR